MRGKVCEGEKREEGRGESNFFDGAVEGIEQLIPKIVLCSLEVLDRLSCFEAKTIQKSQETRTSD
jgi:hypothetical protein